MSRKRIGEVLLERGVITPPQLDAALTRHKFHGERLGAALVALGALDERQLTTALGELQGLPVVELEGIVPEWGALHSLRPEFCQQHVMLPIELRNERGRKRLVVAMADPLNLPAVDEAEVASGARISVVLSTASSIRAGIARHYRLDRGDEVPARSDGRMEVIRPGGASELVDTTTGEEVELEDLFFEEPPPVVSAETRKRLERELHDDLSWLLGGDRIERRFEKLVAMLERKGVLSREELESLLFAEPKHRA